MSVRVRVALVGSNEDYAFKKNQSIAINDALFRYGWLVKSAMANALSKFSEEEILALKGALKGFLFPDGWLLHHLITLICDAKNEAMELVDRSVLKDKIINLPYGELCAILEHISDMDE
nr:hypothetical protein [uncultured Sphaerochaeta sp.]